MADLPKGHTIQTKDFKKVVVGEKLGEGGQGAVYLVEYNGQKKALKWYSGKKIENPKKFYENLEDIIKRGKPSNAFLWPQAVTEKQGEAFGYIMDLRTSEYKDFSRFLAGRECFESITAMVNASLQITEGLCALHQKGLCYQDLNDGTFIINPKTGGVLFCDNDSVCGHGGDLDITGKVRYTAPEIVTGKAKPAEETDNFSLAVILFMLWTHSHPLEGKAAVSPIMDSKSEKKIYGENPVFIFDPNDDSNRPVQGIHNGAIKNWPELPGYVQEAFIKAFSKEAMKDPQIRVSEQDWLKTFTRMKEEYKDEAIKESGDEETAKQDEFIQAMNELKEESAADNEDEW